MCKQANASLKKCCKDKNGKDEICTVMVDDQLVGLISRGDDLAYIKTKLEKLNGCSIIVCAIRRLRNKQMLELVKAFAETKRMSCNFHETKQCSIANAPTAARYDHRNITMAEIIVSLVNNQINQHTTSTLPHHHRRKP